MPSPVTPGCVSSCFSSRVCSGTAAGTDTVDVAANWMFPAPAMVHMYREAIECELLRSEVFRGTQGADDLRLSRIHRLNSHPIEARLRRGAGDSQGEGSESWRSSRQRLRLDG